MEMEENTAYQPLINEEVKSLLERAQRSDGPYEVTKEEFQTLLVEGGRINGIRDAKHEEGWKTQLWIKDPETDTKTYFFVYADTPGQWSKAH